MPGGRPIAQLPLVAAVVMGVAAMALATLVGDWRLPFGGGEPRRAPPEPAFHGPPRVALLVDGLGDSLDTAVRETLALPWPITFAVREGSAHGAEIAAAAHAAGREVVLQLAGGAPPASGFGPRLDELLRGLPFAAGVCHEAGSPVPSDPALMLALLRELRGRRLYYLDAHTTPASVACESARRAGAGCVEGDLFLEAAGGEVRESLLALGRIARERGWALGVARGRPDASPGELGESLRRLEKEGVRLVPAGELAASLTSAAAPS